MGKIIKNGIAYSTASENAYNINFNNTNTTLNAVTVQEAIAELNDKIDNFEIPEGSVSAKDIVVSLSLENWVLNEEDNTYIQEVTAEGIKEDNDPVIVIAPVGNVATEVELNAFNCLEEAITGDGVITFIATKLPEIDFSVAIKGAIGGSGEAPSADLTELENRVTILENKVVESGKDVAVPLLVDGWVLNETDNTYSQTANVTGLTEEANPVILLSSVNELATEEEIKAYACITTALIEADKITFVADEKPAIGITLIVKNVVASDSTVIEDVTALVNKVNELESGLETNSNTINQLNINMENYVLPADRYGNSFENDFLLVDLNTDYSDYHKPSYFYSEDAINTFTNTPDVLSEEPIIMGYREVYRRGPIHVIVKITEMYPVYGRVHVNFYNANLKWRGWKTDTLEVHELQERVLSNYYNNEEYNALDVQNLNDIVKSGIYVQGNSSKATKECNYPRTQGGTVIVMNLFANSILQIYIPVSTEVCPIIYMRNRYNNEWTSWIRYGGTALHQSKGKLVVSDGGTTEGYGIATIDINNNVASIHFSVKITTAGSVPGKIVKLSLDNLIANCQTELPTLKPLAWGQLTYYKSDGTLDLNLNGLGGISNAHDTGWVFARMYENTGTIGSWLDSSFKEGMIIKGTLYANIINV